VCARDQRAAARRRPVDICTEEAWDAVFDANLRSVFLYCKLTVPLLRKSNGR
jgi:NAD(P)-dependent dehydrogenase (short-subunit alcohol dehydrogenase family)